MTGIINSVPVFSPGNQGIADRRALAELLDKNAQKTVGAGILSLK